jgi:hypothetical protein
MQEQIPSHVLAVWSAHSVGEVGALHALEDALKVTGERGTDSVQTLSRIVLIVGPRSNDRRRFES